MKLRKEIKFILFIIALYFYNTRIINIKTPEEFKLAFTIFGTIPMNLCFIGSIGMFNLIKKN